MAAIGVIATLTVAEGKNEDFEAVFAELAAAVRASLGVAAIVAHEEDEGVVEHAALPEAFHEVADGFVHPGHHGCVSGHEVIEAFLLLGGNVLPRLDGGGPRRVGPLLVDEPHFKLAGVTTGPDLFPADPVLTEEFLDLGLGSSVGGSVYWHFGFRTKNWETHS